MPTPPRFTPEEVKELVVLYKKGYSTEAIAARVEANPITVRKYLRGAGVKLVHRGYLRVLNPEAADKLAAGYRAGSTQEELASHYGYRSSTCVSYVLRKLGVRTRPRSFQSGNRHHNWKGGRIIKGGCAQVLVDPDSPYYEMGYVNSPVKGRRRYVLEHRLKMAKKLGRTLKDDEKVLHRDGNGLNNRLSNLVLRVAAPS